MKIAPRDMQLAVRAKRAGANYSLRIVLEARRAGIPVSLAFALVEQESNFKNVFGHDPTHHVGGDVTKARYAEYLRQRGKTGKGGMQGVGPTQLTWWEFQDVADALGGAWKPANNIRVGMWQLSRLIDQYGTREGIARYNGSGPKADAYAESVLKKQKRWHNILTHA